MRSPNRHSLPAVGDQLGNSVRLQVVPEKWEDWVLVQPMAKPFPKNLAFSTQEQHYKSKVCGPRYGAFVPQTLAQALNQKTPKKMVAAVPRMAGIM